LEEEGRRKKEEGRKKKEEGRKKKRMRKRNCQFQSGSQRMTIATERAAL